VKSVEAQLDRDEANRRDAAAKAFSRANNDSQASVVTRTIIEERRRWEEQMYKDIYNGTDILSQQLYASEEGEEHRFVYDHLIRIYIYIYTDTYICAYMCICIYTYVYNVLLFAAARRREEFQRRALVGEVGTAAAKQVGDVYVYVYI
jgi:hypothetical protein